MSPPIWPRCPNLLVVDVDPCPTGFDDTGCSSPQRAASSSGVRQAEIIVVLGQNLIYENYGRSALVESGPTIVGDEWSDKDLMSYLGASVTKALGNNFLEYRSPDPPRIVLNKLETVGYKIVSSCGVGQTCIWTLHKPDTGENRRTDVISNHNLDS